MLTALDEEKKECHFRVNDNWEGRYQKPLRVCWGSGMLAGEEMTDHRFFDKERQVARSEFSNGKVVYVNFGKEEYTLSDGRKLKGEGWIIDLMTIEYTKE